MTLCLVDDLVQLRGEEWRVIGVQGFRDCSVIGLEGCGGENAGVRWSAIDPFDRPQVASRRRWVRRPRTQVLRAALGCLSRSRPAGGLWTAADADVSLFPYQLEPALAVLGGATRVLLADAVGLGKTIQAGLILAELRARGMVDRALILTPAGLRDTWATELRRRFDMTAVVLDHASLTERASHIPPGANPWSLDRVVIASLDLAKRPEVLAAIEAAPFDLLIVDEAHHLTPGSDRGAAAARLGARAPWLVLVSATPHSGDDLAFAHICGLGSHEDGLAIFRRTRHDIGLPNQRREHLLPVAPTPSEIAMLEAVATYARALWHRRLATDRAVQLVATTLARRAASSPTALIQTLLRRLSLLGCAADHEPHQAALPWEDLDDGDGGEGGAWLGTPGLEDAEDERRQLSTLVAIARVAEPEASKTRRLIRLLNRVQEPAVIFTEFRDTLDAIARAIGTSRRVAVIHGGLPPGEREAAVHGFTHGGTDVLLATDAAGEGLSLHQRCRLVITFEMPWSPLRLEQRMGRVDRLGQRRAVHAIHLLHRGSIEDRVLAHLRRRRARATAGLAPVTLWITEDDVAAAVMDDARVEPRAEPSIESTAVMGSSLEARRLTGQRGQRAATTPELNAVVWAAARACRDRPPDMLLLHEVRFVDSRMRLLEASRVAVRVPLVTAPLNRRDWRRAFVAGAADPGVRRAIDEWASGEFDRVAGALDPLRHAAAARLARVSAVVGRHSGAVRQASLFDRRAERGAYIRADVRDRWLSHLARRADTIGVMSAADVSCRIRLVAAWPTEHWHTTGESRD